MFIAYARDIFGSMSISDTDHCAFLSNKYCLDVSMRDISSVDYQASDEQTPNRK